MARLIDADALKTIRSIQSADYNSIETIQHWIDNAPTVDAIPVEWLEWRVMNAKYNGIKEAADAFDFVLKCWKEQEAR